MATYTSTQAGDWDAVATWGGGGYPNASADIVNIGHAVRFNLAHDPAVIVLGKVTVTSGGVFYPHVGMNTLLSIGSDLIQVDNGGALNWKEVPSPYTAGIYFTPLGGGTGFSLGGGAIFDMAGDPAYYGTTPYGFLSVQWAAPASGDSVIQMVGYNGDGYTPANLVADLRGKWRVGQTLGIHKGGTYASYINDFCTVTITSIVKSINNGEAAVNKGGGLVGIPCTGHGCLPGHDVVIANTVNYNGTYTLDASTTANELVITETYAAENFGADDTATYGIVYDGSKSLVPVTIVHLPGGAANFLLGGYVMNLSRNVYWGRYGAVLDIGNYNATNPPGIPTNSIVIGNGTFNCTDVLIIGAQPHQTGHGPVFNRCVMRNIDRGLSGYSGRFTKGTIFSVSYPCDHVQQWVLDAWIAGGGNTGTIRATNSIISGEIFGRGRGGIFGTRNQFNGGWFSNADFQGVSAADRPGASLTMRGRIDKRLDGEPAVSTRFLNYSVAANAPTPQIQLIGVTRPDTLLYTGRNTRGISWRITMEHDKGVKDAHRIEAAFCTAEKVVASGVGGRPTQRVGGDANLYEITPLSNLDAYNPESFMFQRVKLPAGSYELRLYVQTAFAALTSGQLRFFCDYLDEGSGVHAVTGGSVESIAKRYQSINNTGVAVDKGGGKVGIPVTGHAIPAGNKVLFANTVAYNDTYTVHADTTENEIVIEETFVGETFGADDIVHDLGKWNQYLSVNVVLLQEQMVSLYYEVSGYDGSNLIWIDPRVQRVVL